MRLGDMQNSHPELPPREVNGTRFALPITCLCTAVLQCVYNSMPQTSPATDCGTVRVHVPM